MSKTVTISGFVYEVDYGYGDKDYRFFCVDSMGDEHYTLIGPVEFTYEVPESFNPTAQKLAALEREKAAVRAAYLAKVHEIETRISKLQAITYEAEPA